MKEQLRNHSDMTFLTWPIELNREIYVRDEGIKNKRDSTAAEYFAQKIKKAKYRHILV